LPECKVTNHLHLTVKFKSVWRYTSIFLYDMLLRQSGLL
jgi:hypothetical protein